jgi:predicted heme/steroid binding protein
MHMEEQDTSHTHPHKHVGAQVGVLRRYRLLIGAVLLALLLVGGALGYSQYRNRQADPVSGEFDPATVLPAPVSQPESKTVYSTETLKEFDGKDGKKCYVAVKGAVYEIKDSNYWQNGQHTPSAGQGVCGGDMSEVIKGSPHGESILQRLPKVGIYQ